jgi:hypothetical protein
MAGNAAIITASIAVALNNLIGFLPRAKALLAQAAPS